MSDGDMEEREYETYRSLFSNMSNFMFVVFHPHRLTGPGRSPT